MALFSTPHRPRAFGGLGADGMEGCRNRRDHPDLNPRDAFNRGLQIVGETPSAHQFRRHVRHHFIADQLDPGAPELFVELRDGRAPIAAMSGGGLSFYGGELGC